MENKKMFVSADAGKTQKLGEMLARELRGGPASTRSRVGGIICLTGELGSGKTTFAQGILKGLGVKGPYTSPTFVIMKKYHITWNMEHGTKTKNKNMLHAPCSMLHDAYHIDCYRVKSQDILDLGWKEIMADKNNVVIVEWAERIRKIVPKNAVWMNFEHIDKNRRKISISRIVNLKSKSDS